MKTYTLTWKHPPLYGSTLSRCRFDFYSPYWPWSRFHHELQFDHIFAFMVMLSRKSGDILNYRLSSCGRLVARSATYQGV